MIRVSIALPPRPYDALIENGLLQRAGEHLRQVLAVGGRSSGKQRLFLVTVPPVRRRSGKKVTSALAASGLATKPLEMLDGERHKKLVTVEKLAEQLSRL